MSICIPAYKGAEVLGATIDSVLVQTFTDFELIVIDDNSPDETAALVGRYSDPRIRYLRNACNLGPQGNWNRCLEEARGTYFKLLPQDDLLASDCLAAQVAVLEHDSAHEIALVFSAREIIGPTGNVVFRRGYANAAEGRLPGLEVVARCIRNGTNLIGEPGAVLLRKQLADRIGAFDGQDAYVIDLDYWFRLLASGDAYYFDRPLASFRIYDGSWSVAIGAGQTSDFRRFIARIAAQARFSIGRLDRWAGYLMAGVNTRLRRLFYRFMLKGR
ncbi:MAG: glycosyltransferase [Rudaea sp.]